MSIIIVDNDDDDDVGLKDIQSHSFFASIDWALLEVKQMEPPFRPDGTLLDSEPLSYPDLESVLTGDAI